MLHLEKGKTYNRQRVLHQIVDMQYERNDMDFSRGKFRIRGDTLEILPAYEEIGLRIEFFGDEVERIVQIDPLTGELLSELSSIDIYPAKHFVTSHDKLLRAIESIEQELQERIAELKSQGKMLRESGYCNGVENYSRHLSERAAGSAPWTLMDYFPEDYLLMVDESHMTLPQIRGMFHGDLSRKQTLIDFGFRLPSAKDNRPLNYDEFEQRVKQVIYVSATPSPYEFSQSKQVAEQLVRPTGLLEPTIGIKPTKGQIDDLLEQIKARVAKSERCLVTTLTKRMAEELADYLIELDIKTHYLHSEVDTFERVEILRDLRLGVYDVVVGINLLREGLDLPEVSLVAILDADKEGFLRSEGALIQTMGRAARHVDGHVIMYADTITKSMQAAINEIQRRRHIQEEYNKEHGITPRGIKKAIRDITERVAAVAETRTPYVTTPATKEGIARLVKELEAQMKIAAKALDFEKAALIRDRIFDLRKNLDPIDINPRKKYGKR